MKCRMILLGFILFLFAANSCQKKDSNKVRIYNDYIPMYNARIGSLSFGNIDTGEYTSYLPIYQGEHEFTATAVNGDVIRATFQLEGKQLFHTHQWTITIGAKGGLSVEHTD